MCVCVNIYGHRCRPRYATVYYYSGTHMYIYIYIRMSVVLFSSFVRCCTVCTYTILWACVIIICNQIFYSSAHNARRTTPLCSGAVNSIVQPQIYNNNIITSPRNIIIAAASRHCYNIGFTAFQRRRLQRSRHRVLRILCTESECV